MKLDGLFSQTKITFLAGLLACGLSSTGIAQERVGSVIDIDGPRLYTNRLKDQGWFQAYAGMNTFLSERLRTDKQTQAVLRFLVGGLAGIGRNSHIQIISPREVDKVGSTMRINAGTFWAKLEKQEREFQIQTGGGVIGIEGTELLVGVDEKTGVTEVLLFEGQVSVVDKKGNKKTLKPGDYAEFGGAKGMCVLSYPSASLRTLIVERYPKFSSFLASQNITSIPKPASPTLVRGHNKSRPNLLIVRTEAGSSQGSAASGLTPAGSSVSGPPTFRWDPVPGAESYAIFVSNDEAGEELAFSSRSDGTSLTMPEGSLGLDQGRYYWSVVPLNADGKPVGPAATSWFETPGWSTPGVELDDVASNQE